MNTLLFLLMAPAQDGQGAAGSGSMTLIFILLLLLIFYFFMIRPQQKKQKQIEEYRSKLAKGRGDDRGHRPQAPPRVVAEKPMRWHSA